MDTPKSLKDPSEKEHRLSLIYDNHIAPLTNFVNQMRIEKGDQYHIPYFDALDGGINSSILFLLEAPGPNAVKSGFISRNNPDETAKNMFNILQEIEIPRNETVLWNIVPWYIGNGQKIRAANTQDIYQGWSYYTILMDLLPNVDTVVLVGTKAQKIKNRMTEDFKTIKTIDCYHPSPMFINRNIDNRNVIIEQLRALKK